MGYSRADLQADPSVLVGHEVKAADGGNYGHRVLGFDVKTNDYIVQPIRWSDGVKNGSINTIDAFKITYRYCPEEAIPSRE